MRRFYVITRDLHLYFGLFISPFILLFAISVFFLVHGLPNRVGPAQPDVSRTVTGIQIPAGAASLQGRARLMLSDRCSTNLASPARWTSSDTWPASTAW